jgi:hypothetical protein
MWRVSKRILFNLYNILTHWNASWLLPIFWWLILLARRVILGIFYLISEKKSPKWAQYDIFISSIP